eukprot:COSAG04_NODE_201_length_20457_cov_316.186462_1_plen_483_part_00
MIGTDDSFSLASEKPPEGAHTRSFPVQHSGAGSPESWAARVCREQVPLACWQAAAAEKQSSSEHRQGHHRCGLMAKKALLELSAAEVVAQRASGAVSAAELAEAVLSAKNSALPTGFVPACPERAQARGESDTEGLRCLPLVVESSLCASLWRRWGVAAGVAAPIAAHELDDHPVARQLVSHGGVAIGAANGGGCAVAAVAHRHGWGGFVVDDARGNSLAAAAASGLVALHPSPATIPHRLHPDGHHIASLHGHATLIAREVADAAVLFDELCAANRAFCWLPFLGVPLQNTLLLTVLAVSTGTTCVGGARSIRSRGLRSETARARPLHARRWRRLGPPHRSPAAAAAAAAVRRLGPASTVPWRRPPPAAAARRCCQSASLGRSTCCPARAAWAPSATPRRGGSSAWARSWQRRARPGSVRRAPCWSAATLSSARARAARRSVSAWPSAAPSTRRQWQSWSSHRRCCWRRSARRCQGVGSRW